MEFILKQEKFEGPFQLLLELIEKEKLAISDISLAKVTDEYVAYVKTLERIDPEQLAEFLVVAAQLILIKSRSLLPSLAVSEEEEQSIEELEKRLAEFARFRDVAQELKKREGSGSMITREAFAGRSPVFYPPPKLTLNNIEAAFMSFLAALPKVQKLAEEKLKRVISLQDKINHVRKFLMESMEKAFSELVGGSAEKVDVIVSFLAILELARQKFIDLDQDELFSDIKIKRL
ncbi:MAG: segregation/condensation protein A [bacterium]|nr:segregation/condensation protein A [bacterium]